MKWRQKRNAEQLEDDGCPRRVEGLKKQFKDGLSNYRAPDDKYKFPSFTAHPTKNRYQDIVCLEDTRVKLTLNVPPATDYIHANWVKFEGHDKVFIATQVH
ncbi:unnamed protein product [Nippostrongylus brasiliensis]|uniref:Tyrosine-protein phosphatase domain-containing protein n=1 Tax=Nippostrongylus brasiliensis TaxID=27835 RepID=A0A0N4YPW8_NIPBR|nr:unnamed protein product [Nippostrongylus brasiliensis]